MLQKKKFHAPVLSVFLIVGLLLVLACGKKGPPLPPLKDGNAVAPPVELAYTINGNQATISWTHAVDPQEAKIPPEGFTVFVATKDLDGCEGCPFIFKSAGTVGMPEMSFQYTLKEGLHYYFRVQALGKNDYKSKYSETLYIDFQ
ncbi:MAG: fibronectin type III domain-containing protein [Desulfobacterales bacterium]|nr:fibronectin type III domain-containing protein [Desulfobacterales bacterium]